jgi:hypothetical protein
MTFLQHLTLLRNRNDEALNTSRLASSPCFIAVNTYLTSLLKLYYMRIFNNCQTNHCFIASLLYYNFC